MAGNRSPSIFRPTQSPSPQPRRSREDRLRTNLPPRVYYAPSQLAAVVDLTGSNAAYNTPRKRARTAKDSPNNTTNQPTGDGGSSVLPTAPPHQDPVRVNDRPRSFPTADRPRSPKPVQPRSGDVNRSLTNMGPPRAPTAQQKSGTPRHSNWPKGKGRATEPEGAKVTTQLTTAVDDLANNGCPASGQQHQVLLETQAMWSRRISHYIGKQEELRAQLREADDTITSLQEQLNKYRGYVEAVKAAVLQE